MSLLLGETSLLGNSGCIYIISAVVTIIVTVISYYKHKVSYWSKLGFPTLSAKELLGYTTDQLLGRKHFGVVFKEIYENIRAKNHRHAGVYFGTSPVYFPVDRELIKNILQKDFQHFANHGPAVNEKNEPLSAHLFNLTDDKWKNMRMKLAPTFTPKQMKMMFETLLKCTERLTDMLEEATSKNTIVDIKDILARFATDIIGSIAIGQKCKSLPDSKGYFRSYGEKGFQMSRSMVIKFLLQKMLPTSVKDLINFRFTEKKVEDFFMKVVRETVEHREKSNIVKKDFMHLLIQIKNMGKVTDNDNLTDKNTTNQSLTIEELTAQVFLFFLAGFESASTTMTFALYELAVNPDIQTRVRNEIHTVLASNNNQLTYDGLMTMTYTNKVLSEVLRKYPPVSTITRECTKDYIIPGTNKKIVKGTDVIIPVLGLHTDPEYYLNPDIFDPERFTPENISSRPSFTWLPFGEGPRMCIGLRFGLMQCKAGLATILKNYEITLNENTTTPIKISANSYGSKIESDVWLNTKKIANDEIKI